MALRLRLDGSLFCAALNEPEEGDIYLDDGTHYHLSVEKKIIVTSHIDYHVENKGQWWWKGREPDNVEIDSFYYEASL